MSDYLICLTGLKEIHDCDDCDCEDRCCWCGWPE